MVPELKQILFDKCMHFVKEKISNLKNAIDSATISANQETKSSMGDKYETTRAMMHLEIENLSRQLTEWTNTLNELNNCNIETKNNIIKKGAVVITEKTNYFLIAACGKYELDGEVFFSVSVESPIGQLLLGKKCGDIISLRNQKFEIQQIL
jgi:transcription elongation GreA/GreB family factor